MKLVQFIKKVTANPKMVAIIGLCPVKAKKVAETKQNKRKMPRGVFRPPLSVKNDEKKSPMGAPNCSSMAIVRLVCKSRPF